MTTFLVTGVAGFIGSHIAENLVETSVLVRGMDNLSTGFMENLEGFKSHAYFEFMWGDIRDFRDCQKACKGIDVVFHEAALGSVPRSVDNPIGTHENNATGTLNMLHAAREAGVKMFVYASSSSVYGDLVGDIPEPKSESMMQRPNSPYAVSKLAGEQYCRAFWRTYEFPTIALRYFNVYGPRQNPNGAYAAVIPKWITAMLNNDRVVVHGLGYQSRDFTYIKDVVETNLRAAAAVKDARNALGRVFNAGGGGNYTLLEVFEALKTLTGYEGSLEHGEKRPGDVLHSQADTFLLGQILRKKESFPFEYGLGQTVEWYRKVIGR